MISDLRLAFRQLAKSPAFAVTAIATLALGIGVCTAMFSIVHAVLLKPLPFREPDRLVWIENNEDGGLSGRTTRADTMLGWQANNTTFEALAAHFAFSDYGAKVLRGFGEPERLRDVGVSGNFLDVLGVTLLHGRNFTAEETAFNGPGAIILSHDYWQRRFKGDAAIIGQGVTLNGRPATVIGVLPPTFDFDAIFTPGSAVDVLTVFPLTAETANYGNTVFGIGRLKPGVTLGQAQADLTALSERLLETIQRGGKFGASVQPLDTALRGRFTKTFTILMGAVLCILAIACVNLSNLLLARLNVRRQEFSVRVSLGATRRHLIRQAMAESLLLAFLGALVGVPLASWATALLARLQSFGVPLLHESSVDPTALAVTIGLTTLAGIGCGLLPAIYLTHGQRSQGLQTATHQRTAGRSAAKVRNALIVAEVGLACVLLVGAGLLIRSFTALLQVNLGFQPEHAMAWRIDSQRSFNSGQEVAQYLGELRRRVAALPGVEAVGMSDTLPLGRNRSWSAGEAGVVYPPGSTPSVFPRLIDPHYLEVMGIDLRSGRSFDAEFDAKAVKGVIINEHFAEQLWPGVDPLGRKINVNGGSRVIGVVANVRHSSLEEAAGNEMYLDYRQSGDWSTMEMVVRSARPPESLVPEVRAAIAAFDPALPSGEFRELGQLIDQAVGPRRLITRLLGFFSGVALLLAAVGLYGVMAFTVAQRRQEIGIRMAIGAQRADILKMILRGGLKLVTVGVAAGLVGSLALARVLQGQLYGVSAYDPMTFGAIAGLLALVATAACLLPALRATQVHPMVALRSD